MVVTQEDGSKVERSEEFDTVMMAIGRDPCTKGKSSPESANTKLTTPFTDFLEIFHSAIIKASPAYSPKIRLRPLQWGCLNAPY